MNSSDRALVNWEAGDPISPVYAAKLREIQSVFNELKQLMKPEEIGSWLLTEMEEFENRTPADLGRRCFTSVLECRIEFESACALQPDRKWTTRLNTNGHEFWGRENSVARDSRPARGCLAGGWPGDQRDLLFRSDCAVASAARR